MFSMKLEAELYENFLQRKVGVARASMASDTGRDHEDIEADFAARRDALLATVSGSKT